MTSVKDRTAEVLMNYWKENKDLPKFIKVARNILKSSNSNPMIRGELCEVILEVLLREFIKKNNLKKEGWFLVRGLILNDPDNPNSEYLTELDLTLFTPKLIYAFECKSYKGQKMLKDKCTIYLKHGNNYVKKFDVYDQHKKHFVCLHKHLYTNLITVGKDTKPYKLAMFNFSDGDLIDCREDKYKKIFPSLNESTITSLFKNYRDKENFWDINGVRREVVKLLDNKKENTANHLNYVRNLHSNTR